MINKKLIKASLKYLNKGKLTYSVEDILIYRLRLNAPNKKKKSFIKIVSGGLLCTIGFISFPIPTGSVFMIGAGCSLIISGGVDLWGYYRRVERKATLFIYQLSGGRFL